MSNQIACPVCHRSAIEINICPNCQTDLALIRMLHELPSLVTIVPPASMEPTARSRNYWQIASILIAILFSLGLGLCLLI